MGDDGILRYQIVVETDINGGARGSSNRRHDDAA